MKSPASARPPSSGSLKAISYEDTKAAKPPIPITSARSSPLSPHQNNGLRRPDASASFQLSLYPALLKLPDGARRDSGLAPSTNNTPRESRTTLGTDLESVPSLSNSPSFPKLPHSDDRASNSSIKQTRRWGTRKGQSVQKNVVISAEAQLPFMGIVTEIPNGSFEDLTMPDQVQFSKRGSMLIGGKKANHTNGSPFKQQRLIGSRRIPDNSSLSPSANVLTRVLSADDEMLSHKVRSMYEGGTDRASDWAAARCRRSILEDVVAEEVLEAPSFSNANGLSHRKSLITLDENELAGGIEDWEDINGGDVDRYGFIVQRRLPSQGSSINSALPEPPRIQRISTSLQIASEAPRRQRSTVGRRVSTRTQSRSTNPLQMSRSSSRVLRPRSSQSSYQGSVHGGQSKLRSATNLLPHNKDRRIMDEAGDMLTLPPGLANIAESEEDSKIAEELKRKEWEREEKWRKMAKIVNTSKNGGGMTFEFDTKSPKVIERTWKGIPDKWRATAWHAFMTASAKKRKDSPTDEHLIATFRQLVDQGSPDDVQIDIDVPRTISSHIMFRRRYRGGQRLLFRVLHCLSIYFPNTGYVQGMAALAATLLCYFEEEMAFVMLVRLWQLRGLEHLYEPGFDGLMLALEEFEETWLGKRELAAKLVSCFFLPFGPSSFLFSSRSLSFDVLRLKLKTHLSIDSAEHFPYRLWHPMVPHSFQLLDPFSRPAPGLGRLHAPRGLRSSPSKPFTTAASSLFFFIFFSPYHFPCFENYSHRHGQ